MVESEGAVKWLYPGAEKVTTAVSGASPEPNSDMESELQTDQSIQGSEMDKSSLASSETDADSLSGQEDLPMHTLKDISADISNKMAAASSYVGSLFQAPSWYTSQSHLPATNTDASPTSTPSGPAGDTDPTSSPAKPASSFSSSFFSVLGKVAYTDQREGEDEKEEPTAKLEPEEKKSGGGLGYLTSAFSRIGLSNLTNTSPASSTEDKSAGQPPETEGEDVEHQAESADFFTSAMSKVGKAATSYTKVLQETVVAKAPLLADFNKEQEEFIKSKGDKEASVAPWSGYQNEDDLKEKILALSADSRNFLRAPPGGVNFDLETSGVAAHALVLLKEDPRLERMRYELVPKKVKEDEFWRNYFYRVGLVKQSFELTHGLAEVGPLAAKAAINLPIDQEEQDQQHPPEEEFVSDSHRVSSQDLAEADEAMKKLGLAKDEGEWEAELEGELNEYELVEETAANPEWEDEIQAMLAAETSNNTN